jgi:4-amino-4-deoxy-L-arabinose transferase-like glycosyltransferase
MGEMADASTVAGKGAKIPLWLVAGLFLAWALPGLFGREPWKPDEGYTVGLINHVLTQGDWVVPTLTGEPFMEKPPIFFITAALFANLLSPWLLPMHQAAALATLFYVGLTFLFVYLAGREAAGREGGAIAALGLMGCVGFLVRAHTAITDTALWCGFAVACYGMLLPGRRRLAGAFWFGTGAGVAFMAKGLVGPAFIGLAAFLLPLLCPARRGWPYVRMLAWSFVFALPWLVLWPAALFWRSPELFADWFWLNNIGRFWGPGFGFTTLAPTRGPWRYIIDVPWFTLPLWPAVLGLWRRRWREARREAAAVYPSLVVAIGLGMLTMAATQRELYMIPLLIPLAVLAAQGHEDLPPWLGRTLGRIPLYAGGAALAALWAVWLGWVIGFPAGLIQRLEAFAPGLEPGPGLAGVVLALLYTGAWLWFFVFRAGSRHYWPLVWAAGLTAVWGTAMLLFLNVLDHVNSYRAVLASLAEHLPDDPSARLDAYNLGESQRALFEYYHGRRTRAVIQNGREPEAEYLLVQNYYQNPRFDPGAGWRVVWEGARPGDTKEWYVLFYRPKGGD